MPFNPVSLKNLKPIQKGEVRNPEGKNQFTYKSKAEQALERFCKEYGDLIIEETLKKAAKGTPWAAKLVLDRILPIQKESKLTHTIEKPAPFLAPTEERRKKLEATMRRMMIDTEATNVEDATPEKGVH